MYTIPHYSPPKIPSPRLIKLPLISVRNSFLLLQVVTDNHMRGDYAGQLDHTPTPH
jgi:hypothetical protein